jgi:poly(3-hydroxybutyrate) depolymerase
MPDSPLVEASTPASAEPITAPIAPASAAQPGLAPLPGFFEALAVPGHPDAWLSLPTGATGPRPVVVVIHGAGDRPDWQCGGWRRATGGYPFIVCPRGAVSARDSSKDDARYTHASGPALAAHIDAALNALAARYPGYADIAPPILLAGFSLGSYEIVPIAVEEAPRFPSLALVEGITDSLDDARAKAFAAAGGKRVLFGCGQRGCEATAKVAARRIEQRDGLAVAEVFASVNHTFDPPLEDAIGSRLAWLVQDDPRWQIDAGR